MPSATAHRNDKTLRHAQTTAHREKTLPRRVAFREATDRQEWACSQKAGGRREPNSWSLLVKWLGVGPLRRCSSPWPQCEVTSTACLPSVGGACDRMWFVSARPWQRGRRDRGRYLYAMSSSFNVTRDCVSTVSTAVIPFRHLQTVLISVLAPTRMAHQTPMGANSFRIAGTVEAST